MQKISSISLVMVVLIVITLQSTMATQVSFFEEFPNQTTLDKIAQIDFETRIYLAASNLSSFQAQLQEILATNSKVKEVIYWPTLPKYAGYWISPWADAKALHKAFEEIKERKDKSKLEVMLDLEPSLQRSRLLQFQHFNDNKNYIAQFIAEAHEFNVSITTVEKWYAPDTALRWLGLSYDPTIFGHERVKMVYSSYTREYFPEDTIDAAFEAIIAGNASRIGIGLIAPGIHDETAINSPAIVQKEIELARKYNIKEVIIFRLDGLNEEYRKAIHEGLGVE